MEQYPLIGLADAERVTNLFAVPALDVTQGKDRPLRGRKRLDRLSEQLAGFHRDERVLGPRLRLHRPVPWPAGMLRIEEAVRVDRGLRNPPGILECREGQRAPVSYRSRLRDVGQDPEDPRSKRG